MTITRNLSSLIDLHNQATSSFNDGVTLTF